MDITKYFDTTSAVDVIEQSSQAETLIGEFTVMVDSSEAVKSPKTQAEGVVIKYVVIGGQYDGCIIKEPLFFVKSDGGFNNMAKKQYAELCQTFGFDIVAEDKMFGKRLLLKTKKNEKNDKYIDFFKYPLTQSAQTASGSTALDEQAKKMPWAK